MLEIAAGGGHFSKKLLMQAKQKELSTNLESSLKYKLLLKAHQDNM